MDMTFRQIILFVSLLLLSCGQSQDPQGDIEVQNVEAFSSHLVVQATNLIGQVTSDRYLLMKGCLSCDEIKLDWFSCNDTQYTNDRCASSTEKNLQQGVTKIILKPETDFESDKYFLQFLYGFLVLGDGKNDEDYSTETTFWFEL